jgi:Helix-turn-helix domain
MSNKYLAPHNCNITQRELTNKKLTFIAKAMEDGTLTLSSKVVLYRLLMKHYNNKTARCDPNEETLAADLKLSERTVRYAIKQLKVCGWLSVQQRFNASNQYHFNWDRQILPLGVEAKNDTSGGRKRHERRQNLPVEEAKSRHLTIERTNERTNERTHTERACVFVDCSSDERETNSSGKDGSHGEFNSSLKAQAPCPSPSARDASNSLDGISSNLSLKEGNPFAHLGEDDFPSQENIITPSQQTNIPCDFLSRRFGYEFSEFWRVFPPERKYNQEATYEAFVDAVENNTVDARSLAIIANRYKNFCKLNLHRREDKRYISKPETWLRDERWLDTTRQTDICNDPDRPSIADEPPPPATDRLTLESTGLTEQEIQKMMEAVLAEQGYQIPW